MAEAVGFEPTDDFTRHSISSRDRYDHFDTPPYLGDGVCAVTEVLYTKNKKKSRAFFIFLDFFCFFVRKKRGLTL